MPSYMDQLRIVLDPRLKHLQDLEKERAPALEQAYMTNDNIPAPQPTTQPNVPQAQPRSQIIKNAPIKTIEEQLLDIYLKNQAQEKALALENTAREKAGIKQMQDVAALRAATSPAQVDLSPLAALSDSLTGSNLSKGYARPTGQEEMAKTAFEQLAKIQDKKNDLSMLASRKSSDMDMLRSMLTQGRYSDKRSLLTPAQIENANKFENLIQEAEDLEQTLQDDFVGPVNQLKGLPLIENIGSNQDASVYLSKLGRLVDKYRTMVTGSAAADAELRRIATRMPQAKQSPALFRKQALQVIEDTKRAYQTYLDTLEKGEKNVERFRESGTATESTPPKTKSFDEWKKSRGK